MRRRPLACVLSFALSCAAFADLHAQTPVTLTAEALFYGDNTEFQNPFREGETLLGAAVRAGVEFELAPRVTFRLGAFGNQRFGSEDAFEQVRPVIALEVRGRRSAFIFGTLPAPRVGDPPGPDRTGPHGLLPPLQRETLAFERPYEAGLMWTSGGAAFRHEAWVHWQRLNTAGHRERLDAGAAGSVRLDAAWSIPFQYHVVHEGGQLFASGPVADSHAAALGLALTGKPGGFDAVSLEMYVAGSRFVPDREQPERSRSGAGFFSRASLERAQWRGHLIVWRGDDYVKDEGDPNYLAVRRDGSRYRGVRDYAEAGVTRTFRPAAGVRLEASARIHRVEDHYEYSYRIVGVATARVRLRP
ncbi:MAG TPA: hypothetical protein VD833_06785 [Vicinamibacterales bacterium]|nr:hypothetical protein [Vicinamibacterales bacterium]